MKDRYRNYRKYINNKFGEWGQRRPFDKLRVSGLKRIDADGPVAVHAEALEV